MTVYVPTSGANVAAKLTMALWSLSRPPSARSASEVTDALFACIECLDHSVWLEVITDFEIPVHHAAELDGIADVLQPLVNAGDIPASVIDDLRATVIRLRGQRLVVWDAFPLFFQQQAKSHDDLVEMNLLRALT